MTGKAPSLRSQIEPLLKRGLTNNEIIALMPKRSQGSIRATATLMRRQLGVPCPTRQGPLLSVPENLCSVFDYEAECRGARSGYDLIIQALAIIVHDDLFDAVFGVPRDER